MRLILPQQLAYLAPPKTPPVNMGVYLGLEQLRGMRATTADLVAELVKLGRSDVIRWVAAISVKLAAPNGMTNDIQRESKEGIRSEYSRRRWPFYIKARNLTPEYGRVWNEASLQPFPLAKAYNEGHPEDPAQIGAILHGNDKARIPRLFAELLIRRIRELA